MKHLVWKNRLIVGWLLASVVMAVCAPVYAQTGEAAFQVSTLSALLRGIYDGAITCGELKQHGNFGIGTLEGLDGEMVLLDGQVYQVKADGRVLAVGDQAKTPFATVTFFAEPKSIELSNIATFKEAQHALESILPNRNIFYAFRIDGTFSYIKTRSVPRQDKPYPPLAEVTKNQPVFEFQNIKGTLVGFWCPDYIQGINVPGFHLHFISADRSAGGHVIDFTMLEGTAKIAKLSNFNLMLPDNDGFRSVELAKDWHSEI